MMDTTDYIIIKTHCASDIKHDDYILVDNMVYKIHQKKYQSSGKLYSSVIYKCCNFLESKVEFLKFPLKKLFDEYIKFEFKKEISKIVFTIKSGTFVDYNYIEKIISFLDDECNLVHTKCDKNTKKVININDENLIKYIKYNDNYKIII